MVHLKTGVSLAEADHWYRNGPASVSPVPGAVSPVPGVCVTCAQRLASTAANGSGRKTGRGQHDISVQGKMAWSAFCEWEVLQSGWESGLARDSTNETLGVAMGTGSIPQPPCPASVGFRLDKDFFHWLGGDSSPSRSSRTLPGV